MLNLHVASLDLTIGRDIWILLTIAAVILIRRQAAWQRLKVETAPPAEPRRLSDPGGRAVR
jgi:hypothetical protein